jgi:tRNA nucleotidyltransferase (CCA-adding enzyme)
VLQECGALARLAPELHAWCAADGGRCADLMRALDAAPATPPALRFACLCHGLQPAQIRARCERWRVDADSRELALLVAREWPLLCASGALTADGMLALLERCDAWRRPERTRLALAAWRALRPMLDEPTATRMSLHVERIAEALRAAQRVSVATLPAAVRDAAADGPALGQALRQARLQAIAQILG